MKVLFFPPRNAALTALAGAAGFAGGAVLGPAVLEQSPADNVTLFLLSGVLGALVWLVLLAGVTRLLSGRPARDHRP